MIHRKKTQKPHFLIAFTLFGLAALLWIYVLPDQIENNEIIVSRNGISNRMQQGVLGIFSLVFFGCVSLFFGVKNLVKSK
jgi:hypothetical protein